MRAALPEVRLAYARSLRRAVFSLTRYTAALIIGDTIDLSRAASCLYGAPGPVVVLTAVRDPGLHRRMLHIGVQEVVQLADVAHALAPAVRRACDRWVALVDEEEDLNGGTITVRLHKLLQDYK